MDSQKSERELLVEINEKLTQILGVMAIHGKDQDDQIRILTNMGFDGKTTADMVGMTHGALRNRKSQLKLTSNQTKSKR